VRTLLGPSILDYTHGIFAAKVEGGRMHPQEACIVSSELDNDESDGGGHSGDTNATSRTYTCRL
jgi:hypothetical protein